MVFQHGGCDPKLLRHLQFLLYHCCTLRGRSASLKSLATSLSLRCRLMMKSPLKVHGRWKLRFHLNHLSSSGAESGPGQASTTAAAASSSDAGSDPEQALAADVSGLEQALRAVAAISGRAVADGVSLEQAMRQHAAGVSEALRVGGRSVTDLHNPWNLFQHENRGKGWSPAKVACMYTKWRQHPKDKMP